MVVVPPVVEEVEAVPVAEGGRRAEDRSPSATMWTTCDTLVGTAAWAGEGCANRTSRDATKAAVRGRERDDVMVWLCFVLVLVFPMKMCWYRYNIDIFGTRALNNERRRRKSDD